MCVIYYIANRQNFLKYFLFVYKKLHSDNEYCWKLLTTTMPTDSYLIGNHIIIHNVAVGNYRPSIELLACRIP